MAAAATDYFTEVGSPGTATTLAAPGHIIAGTAITVVATSNWPTATGVIFAMDTVTIVDGEEVRDVGSYTEWEGVVASATSITGMVLRVGSDQNYPAGSTTRVYIPVAATHENRIVQGIVVDHLQTGRHKVASNYDPSNTSLETQKWVGVASAVNELTATNAAAGNAPELSATGDDSNIDVKFTPKGTGKINFTKRFDGWVTGLTAPSTITALGNRSYSMVFNTLDMTPFISVGNRLKLTRTVTAPTQCTSLNGTTQYFNKTTPNKMTFTDDFTVSAWVKMNAYGANISIASRYNGTSGWSFQISDKGSVQLIGYNAGAANLSYIQSYAAIPLGKWVHVTAQLDMSSFTNTPTTSYVMIDGIDVPALPIRAGTNPTALIQAGNLEIGSINGGTQFWNGKIAQVAVYSAKVTQATILASIDRTLTGSETSLASAYSFGNSIADLNTTTPNDLTAQASAVATNADSPFAGGSTASTANTAGTTEFGEVFAITFSTNTTITVQVPDGYAIPTTGGVSALAYSTAAAPLGWQLPGGIRKLAEVIIMVNQGSITTNTALLGMLLSGYIPAGRVARVIAKIAASNTAAAGHGVSIYNGTTISGVFVDSSAIYLPTLGTANMITAQGDVNGLSGSQSFIASLAPSGGTATTSTSTTAPGRFVLELV